jgi:serine/threonine-protein kinase
MDDAVPSLAAALGSGFRLERELGGGGMARVFLATELALDRRVVVKVLPPALAAGVSVDRFRREVALAARMQHPHIVPLLAAGTTAEPLWFTMPYVEGESLRTRLVRQGELPLGDAVRLLREIADALAHAHRAGVVHRDIKPENVLLSGGHAMVTDFGVAKALAAGGEVAPGVTDVGLAVGTPAYMSPEQASADPTVDARADIYAFGVVAFELLVGRPPFEGRTAAQVIRMHLTEVPPSLTTLRDTVSPALADLVARCLAKRPADRPQTADELLAILDAVATPAGTPVGATGTRGGVTPATQPVATGARRRRAVAIGGGALAAAIAAGVLWQRRAPAETPRPRDRVVVVPFVNATGNAAFDGLGPLVASWAQDAFIATGLLDVADYRALTLGADGRPSTTPAGAGGLTAFASAAGASRLLTGSVFAVGDSLEFRASIVDADGRVVLAVPVVRAAAAEPLPGIEQLAQRAAGALASAEDSASARQALAGARHLPTYAAYREFSAGVDSYSSGQSADAYVRFTAAVAADPEFLTAALWRARTLINVPGGVVDNGRRLGADSGRVLLDALAARRGELSALDQAMLDEMRAGLANPAARIDALTRAARLWPDRWATGLAQAYYQVGKPRETIRIASAIDPTVGFMRSWRTYWQTLTYGYLMAGDTANALDAARRGLERFPDASVTVCTQAMLHALTGREAEADSLIWTVLPTTRTTPVESVGRCRSDFTLLLLMRGAPDVRRRVARRWVDRPAPRGGAETLRRFGPIDVFAWQALGEARRAASVADSLAAIDSSRGLSLLLAQARHVAGDTAGARAAETTAATRPAPPIDAGGFELAGAWLATARGDRDGAVALLRRALDRGMTATRVVFFAPPLAPLIGYPPYEALIVR